MQLGAGTSLFCLSQYAIPFCTLLAESDTWEGRENLKNAKKVIKEFEKEY